MVEFAKKMIAVLFTREKSFIVERQAKEGFEQRKLKEWNLQHLEVLEITRDLFEWEQTFGTPIITD